MEVTSGPSCRSDRARSSGAHAASGHYVNCTGDGFLAVLPLQKADTHEGCLHLAIEIMRACREYPGPPLKIRFGLHEGNYRSDVEAFKGRHIIGNGPNRVARVVGIADESQIVVSEDFFHGCDSAGWAERFTEPIEFQAKHNESMVVRVDRGSSEEEKGLLNDRLPSKIWQARLFDEAIKKDLARLEDLIVHSLFGSLTKGRRDKIQCRVSVFVPINSHGQLDLFCGEYRFQWGKGHVRGKSRYSTRPPTGPVGVAFAKGTMIVIRGLPDPGTCQESCV